MCCFQHFWRSFSWVELFWCPVAVASWLGLNQPVIQDSSSRLLLSSPDHDCVSSWYKPLFQKKYFIYIIERKTFFMWLCFLCLYQDCHSSSVTAVLISKNCVQPLYWHMVIHTSAAVSSAGASWLLTFMGHRNGLIFEISVYSNGHGNTFSSENQLELSNSDCILLLVFMEFLTSLKGKACLKTESAIWSFSRNLFMRDAKLK